MSRSYVEWKSGHLDVAGEVGVQVLHLFISLQAVKKLHMYVLAERRGRVSEGGGKGVGGGGREERGRWEKS